ncbi:DUF4358 domain-containing protein [Romboutsia weinsteinii]|uniref:DUF4358 domain-containing protein n=1 Tax=Romboutsia weinsteinii TaxID=2020949 RepID=A0A371J3Y7_9FIRM|nr:DUF4358 domain-containing protein [Romboutsia weinsteinii]RDY27386.1 DUF4358 domain-containing protein [Romboutsia weinsteinii]
MKKIILILSLVLTMGMVGCSSKGSNEYKDVPVSQIQKAIESSSDLVEQSMPYEISNFDYFNDVQDKITEGFIIKAAINLRLEDVIVIKTEDPDAIYTTLENYKEDMIVRPFGDGYGAEENADYSANTIIEKKGNYVYLISAKNATNIEKTILSVISK